MASLDQAVTAVPTPLAGVVEGTEYAIQNGGAVTVFAAVAAAAPDTSKRTFSAAPGRWLYQTAGVGESIFVWTSPDAVGVWVAYEESS